MPGMNDDQPDDKTYAEAVLNQLLQNPSLTEWQRAVLMKARDQELRLARIEDILRAEGKL
jgi:hypothetical protein